MKSNIEKLCGLGMSDNKFKYESGWLRAMPLTIKLGDEIIVEDGQVMFLVEKIAVPISQGSLPCVRADHFEGYCDFDYDHFFKLKETGRLSFDNFVYNNTPMKMIKNSGSNPHEKWLEKLPVPISGLNITIVKESVDELGHPLFDRVSVMDVVHGMTKAQELLLPYFMTEQQHNENISNFESGKGDVLSEVVLNRVRYTMRTDLEKEQTYVVVTGEESRANK